MINISYNPESEDDVGDKSNHLKSHILSMNVMNSLLEKIEVAQIIQPEIASQLKELWIRNLDATVSTIEDTKVDGSHVTRKRKHESTRYCSQIPIADTHCKLTGAPYKAPIEIISQPSQRLRKKSFVLKQQQHVGRCCNLSRSISSNISLLEIETNPPKCKETTAPTAKCFFPPFGMPLEVHSSAFTGNPTTEEDSWILGRISQWHKISRTRKVPAVSVRMRGGEMIELAWPSREMRPCPIAVISEEVAMAATEDDEDVNKGGDNDDENADDLWLLRGFSDGEIVPSSSTAGQYDAITNLLLDASGNLEDVTSTVAETATTAAKESVDSLDIHQWFHSQVNAANSVFDSSIALRNDDMSRQPDEQLADQADASNRQIDDLSTSLARELCPDWSTLGSYEYLSKVNRNEIDSYFSKLGSCKKVRVVSSRNGHGPALKDSGNTNNDNPNQACLHTMEDPFSESDPTDGAVIAVCSKEKKSGKVWEFKAKQLYVCLDANEYTVGDIVLGPCTILLDASHYSND